MDQKQAKTGILKDTKFKQRHDGKEGNEPLSIPERASVSPQPSVDRLSVTWADPEESTNSVSTNVNLFVMATGTPLHNMEVRFPATPTLSHQTEEGSEDEEYSARLNEVIWRRNSTRRSRKGRARRPSSPFLPDENIAMSRRRSSVFTTSSGDTAISMDDGQQEEMTQEMIYETIRLHKEVLISIKQEPIEIKKKLKLIHQARAYVKKHEGQLQERLAQSKNTRDIYASFKISLASKLQHLKRELANASNMLIPWESRIKEIESHFGSVVASYFTFLRWLFWVNFGIAAILILFVIVPEVLTADHGLAGERKHVLETERNSSLNLFVLWQFDGYLKCSPIFYGYYTNVEYGEYNMPLAYFLTGLVVYIYSFVATLRKMAENSRMSKLSAKEDECVFSWKLFTGWDFMIGNAETAHNRTASITLGFKEALLEEAEKKKNPRNWRIITRRLLVNICILVLFVTSASAVVSVVTMSDDEHIPWYRESSIVMTAISIFFPMCFEVLGHFELYHPRKQLRLQLGRIMVLNLLNINSLIFAQFTKIHSMTVLLEHLRPVNDGSISIFSHDSPELIENRYVIPQGLEILFENETDVCYGRKVKCSDCYHMISTTEPYPLAENLEEIKNFRNNDSNSTNATSYLDVLIYSENNNDTIYGINTTVMTDYDYSQDDNTTDAFHLLDDSVIDFQRGYHLPFKDETTSIINNSNETSFTDGLLETEDLMPTINNDNNVSDEINKNWLTSSTKYEIETTTDSVELEYVNTSDLNSQESPKSFEDTMPKTYYTNNAHINSSEILSSIDSYKTCFMEYRCYRKKRSEVNYTKKLGVPSNNKTKEDYFYYDDKKNLLFELTLPTKINLSRLCWETMFGQELVRLTMTDLVFTILGILFFDFFRALFVRFMNGCWCWDLEKKFPEYGDFKIAENILHLINNQGIVWMGMFFSPGIVIINTVKLVVLMYLRSWAVMTCNVPHEVVFKASKSNNFYLALLLTMLFLCVLPVGYALVWVKPSWHCGPFSKFDRIYKILTNYLDHILPKNLKSVVEYVTSPGIVIPLLVLLIFIIYYLTSLTYSLKEALQDLKFQLRRERTEERRKVFQIADRRRRAGSLSLDNTPFSKWKMALPHLKRHKSSDSDDQKEGGQNANKSTKKQRGDFFAKIVEMAKARNVTATDESKKPSPTPLLDDETDTEFHESLPDDVNQFKDTKIKKLFDMPSTNTDSMQKENISEKNVIFKGNQQVEKKDQSKIKKEILRKMRESGASKGRGKNEVVLPKKTTNKFSFSESEQTESTESFESRKPKSQKNVDTASNRSDSIGSVIPVITISKIESDDDLLEKKYITVVSQASSRTSKNDQFGDSTEIEDTRRDKNDELNDNGLTKMQSGNINKTDESSASFSNGQSSLKKLKIVGSIPKTKESK